MYMPTLARFTSRDPLADTAEPVMGGLSAEVQAAIIQQYAYANNSPPNFMDPSGLEAAVTRSSGFYIDYETNRDPKAERCSCLHTDIGFVPPEGEPGERVRIGAGGDDRGLGFRPDARDRLLVQCTKGTLMYGPSAGKRCSQALNTDIKSCLALAPTEPYDIVSANCQYDVGKAANSCCLCTWKPVGPGEMSGDTCDIIAEGLKNHAECRRREGPLWGKF